MTGDSNHMTVSQRFGPGDRILTPEQLLEKFEVNLDEWEVERTKINKWEMGSRAPKKSLVYENGKIVSGSIEDLGETKTTELFQIDVDLRRKIFVAVELAIHPVEVTPVRLSSYKRATESSIKRALLLPDPHFGFSKDLRTGELIPFHDRPAIHAALQLAEHVQPDRIVWMGDMLDLADWSDKFLRSPDMYWTTQQAIIEAAAVMAGFIEVVPDAKVDLLEGNHDRRLNSALVTHLKQAYELRAADELELPPALSVERLLACHSMGIEYHGPYPSAELWLNNSLRLIHGNLLASTPGGTASKLVSNAIFSTGTGHSHRLEMATRMVHTNDDSYQVYGFSLGCLCKVDGTVPGSSRRGQWEQGVGIIDYDDDGWHSAPRLIPIQDGTLVYDKIQFDGDDFDLAQPEEIVLAE